MPYSLDLTGPQLKLKRAKEHIDAFHWSVEKKLGPHPIYYSLRSEFNREQGAVVFYLKQSVEIDSGWSLIIGDAIHNLRGALDHLAWQLAVRHCDGVEPADPHSIKFPIRRDPTKWPPTFFDDADSDKLKDFQPFSEDGVATAHKLPHPLVMLQCLSNSDKHQTIQVTTHHPAVYDPKKINLRDCEFIGGNIKLTAFWGAPSVGEEILRVPVRPIGDHPDAELEGGVSFYIAVRERWNVEDALTMIYQRIETLLGRF